MRITTCVCLVTLMARMSSADVAIADAPAIKPIHLDDIHFVVTDEGAAVEFFKEHFGAREMAHPGTRFELVRFLSLQWQEPTITITPTGPYDDLPADRNKRWSEATIVTPNAEKDAPVFGARWLALATPSLANARKTLLSNGVKISEDSVSLPMEPNASAFSIYGPDGAEIVIVERPGRDYLSSLYAIDHIQFLVKDLRETRSFFSKTFAGQVVDVSNGSAHLKVADADLIVSEPEALDIPAHTISPRTSKGEIRIGLDHLGFLYSSVSSAVSNAARNGVEPVFSPQRYLYKGRPTVYIFTAFLSPDDFSVEMVQADGRVGPHSYYMDQNQETTDD